MSSYHFAANLIIGIKYNCRKFRGSFSKILVKEHICELFFNNQ